MTESKTSAGYESIANMAYSTLQITVAHVIVIVVHFITVLVFTFISFYLTLWVNLA